jgi:hypothetical protein
LIALRDFPLGPDKEAFHRYLMDFRAVDDDERLLETFAGCEPRLLDRAWCDG